MKGKVQAASGPAANGQQQVVVPRVPFINAAHEHSEPMEAVVITPTDGGGKDHGPISIPAHGFMRAIILEIDFGAPGAIGDAALHADFPWSIFERIAILDTNGSPIFDLDGYGAYIANVVGGFAFQQDPVDVDFDGTITGKAYLRVPIEVNHYNALGAISNMNAAGPYKLFLRTRAALDGIFAAAKGTAVTPEITIKPYLESWSVPARDDLAGRPQEQYPPMHGMSQYWTSSLKDVIVSSNGQTEINKTGNMIRNLAIIARDVSGDRDDTVFFDPVRFHWDGNELRNESQRVNRILAEEKINNGTRGLPVGVYLFPFAHSELGRNGDGPASLWLGTVQGARMEVKGNIETAGSHQVIINDIAPVEVDQSQRVETPNDTGQVGMVA